MSQITLDLPETLYHQLETQAKREGIVLNQYILYALTRQLVRAYTVQAVPAEDVERQRAEFNAFLQKRKSASPAEIEQVLAERERVEPEPDLTPELVMKLEETLARKGDKWRRKDD